MMKGQAKRYYLFGLFRLDVTERLLYGAGGVIPLTPKAFETLLVLVEHSGHVLSKEELMEKVWPDSFVEENNLAQNISVLRKVLSEGGGEGGKKFIETVPKRGYRFSAEVRESSDVMEPVPNNKVESDCTSRQQQRKRKSPLRDVVIIGRAINFK